MNQQLAEGNGIDRHPPKHGQVYIIHASMAKEEKAGSIWSWDS
jgi:hypothetical protein